MDNANIDSSIHIPRSSNIVQVSVIDTTFRISDLPASIFLGPELPGFETLSLTGHAFLISHVDNSTGRQQKILFDLGPPRDWTHDLPAPLVQRVQSWGARIEIEKYVSEILEEGGIPLKSIDTIFWSHAHWDHTGRTSLFPHSTSLVVGPGIKSAFFPGFPQITTSPVLSRDFAGRTVIELDFSASRLSIGGFEALDYFEDGSFYLLNCPGHAIGHICALARTTVTSSESTFLLMGADTFHHPSQIRPHMHAPIPLSISSFIQDLPISGSCIGECFETIHPAHPDRKFTIPQQYINHMKTSHADPKTTPLFTIAQKETGETVAVDIAAARESIRRMQVFDGADNVFVVGAHDATVGQVISYFPETANQWRTKGWKDQSRWIFLQDLTKAIAIAQPASTVLG